MDLQLGARVVLVTGAAGGVGQATVAAFLAEGAQVLATDLSPAPDAFAYLSGVERLTYVQTDLLETGAVPDLMAASTKGFGRTPDICINNAAVTHRAEFLEMTAADFARVQAINLHAPFALGQAVAKALVADGREGSIVNIGSVNAQLALPDNAAYVASKGGLLQLTRAMAVALAPQGIRVNMVAPGSIDTPLQRAGQSRSPALRARVLSRTPLGRLGDPAEVADAILFMASPRSSYITGECLFVDGGRLPLNFTMPVPDAGANDGETP